ncbi:competence protein ComK [Bacillus tuaregi]|uniref:competence protein ComK n=1 Tax=Bacillus tuaregi TaxID=1816695 RepID=UPI0008F818B9|nr:competence protein ComK [Bacillus tuaregi]
MVKTEIIEEYQISRSTLAILPMEYGSKLYSQIYDLEVDQFSPLKPLELIKKSCRSFCSSYEGRKEGSRQLIGFTHKIPITIDSTNMLYFFPTASPLSKRCAWVSHVHVLHYEKIDSATTLVYFRNKKTVIIPTSVYTFENQMLRTALLRTNLMQKKQSGGQERVSLSRYRLVSKASENSPEYGGVKED